MYMTRHRAAGADDQEVSFPKLECWNPMTKVATIAAEWNARRVLCRISLKLLQERFSASASEPMAAVAENRSAIQDAAKKLIEKERFEEDGSIVIGEKDI